MGLTADQFKVRSSQESISLDINFTGFCRSASDTELINETLSSSYSVPGCTLRLNSSIKDTASSDATLDGTETDQAFYKHSEIHDFLESAFLCRFAQCRTEDIIES
jgi:hypothetical protein